MGSEAVPTPPTGQKPNHTQTIRHNAAAVTTQGHTPQREETMSLLTTLFLLVLTKEGE